MLSKRGLRPEAFISPGDAKDETVVFISADGRLHVRSAAAPTLGSAVSSPAVASGRPRTKPPLCSFSLAALAALTHARDGRRC